MSLAQIFCFFFKLSAITFGGGVVILGIINVEFEKRDDITSDELYDITTLATAMPGPIAVSISWLLGKYYKGVLGGIIGVIGAVLPPFLVILFLSPFIIKYSENPHVRGFLYGVLATTCAIITLVIINHVKKTLFLSKWNIIPYVLILILIGILKLNPLIIIPFVIALQFVKEKVA